MNSFKDTKNLKAVDDLHKQGRYKEALQVLNLEVAKKPDSFEGLFARFYRARAFEGGFFGDVNHLLAEDDYRYLVERTDILGVGPSIGLARVLFKENKKTNYSEIIDLCDRVNSIKKNKKAMLIMGAANEFLVQDYAKASRFYVKAFFMGSKWGLPFCLPCKN